jgi:transposase
MIPMPSGVRVWIAAGHTDMRRGMQGLALQVQEQLKRDPHGGDLCIFRGRRGDLAKILWHDGLGLSLYAKRLDRGKFIWPSAKEGVILSMTSGYIAADSSRTVSITFHGRGSRSFRQPCGVCSPRRFGCEDWKMHCGEGGSLCGLSKQQLGVRLGHRSG